jgi:ferredoxin
MTKVPGSKKLKAVVDEEKCMGCGLCVLGCESKAMIFDLVKPPEYLAIDHQQDQRLSPFSDEKVPIWSKFASAP